MNLDINKVIDFTKEHTGWWHDGMANGEIIEQDNKTTFNDDDHTLSFEVRDNTVIVTTSQHPSYDEESYVMTRSFTYLEDKVHIFGTQDSYYYDDVKPVKGKEPELRHLQREYERDESLDNFIPINELYTPSKIK